MVCRLTIEAAKVMLAGHSVDGRRLAQLDRNFIENIGAKVWGCVYLSLDGEVAKRIRSDLAAEAAQRAQDAMTMLLADDLAIGA